MEAPLAVAHEKYTTEAKVLTFLDPPDQFSFAASIITYTLFSNGDIMLRVMPIIDKTKNFAFDIQLRIQGFDEIATAMTKPIIHALAFRPAPPKSFDPDELNFSRFMNSVLKTNYAPTKMSDNAFFDLLYTDDQPLRLDTLLKTKVHLKLFPENKEHYCELFLNIDLPNRVIELIEKDIDYRDAIYKVFFNASTL